MSGQAKPIASRAKTNVLPIAARRHPLVREVDRQLASCGLTFSGEGDARPLNTQVVIGVSGGVDSVALLLACIALQGRKRRLSEPFEPVVVHVHHHLREAAADIDAAWVASLCEKFEVECRVEHVHPGDEKGNTCANARRLRYAAMARIATRIGAKHVMVAHHADDQLETMLMAMCRGAGPRGMAGMRMVRSLGQLQLLRPLLHARRRDCEEMCRKAEVEWREDASNRDVSRRRARLRRDVLPVLEELWPGAAKRAARNALLLDNAQHRC